MFIGHFNLFIYKVYSNLFHMFLFESFVLLLMSYKKLFISGCKSLIRYIIFKYFLSIYGLSTSFSCMIV